MTIIEQIIDELVKLVKNKKIDYLYSHTEDCSDIEFGDKRIIISNFFNRYENSFYYQISFSTKESNNQHLELVIDQKNEVYSKVDHLYKFIEKEQFEFHPFLHETLEELKTGKFKRIDKNVKINTEPPEDDLPF